MDDRWRIWRVTEPEPEYVRSRTRRPRPRRVGVERRLLREALVERVRDGVAAVRVVPRSEPDDGVPVPRRGGRTRARRRRVPGDVPGCAPRLPAMHRGGPARSLGRCGSPRARRSTTIAARRAARSRSPSRRRFRRSRRAATTGRAVAAVAELPPRQRDAVTYRHVLGLSVAEAAELMGCSPETVRANAYQGLQEPEGPRMKGLMHERLAEDLEDRGRGGLARRGGAVPRCRRRRRPRRRRDRHDALAGGRAPRGGHRPRPGRDRVRRRLPGRAVGADRRGALAEDRRDGSADRRDAPRAGGVLLRARASGSTCGWTAG